MVVGIFKFIPFIWNRRIENVFDSVVDQPLNMSVSQFCRITFGFTWNGFDTEFVNFFSIEDRREYDTESEFGEKCKPEWIIFVHVKYTGNSDYSSRGIFFGKRFIIENTDEIYSQTSLAAYLYFFLFRDLVHIGFRL